MTGIVRGDDVATARERYGPSPMERLLAWRRAEHVWDVLLALALFVFAQLDLRLNIEAADHYGSELVAALATAVATLALAFRRRMPLVTASVVAVAVAGPQLFTVLTIQLWGDFAPLLIAAYSVTRYAPARRAATGAAALAVALLVVEIRVPVSGTTANIPFIWVPFLLCCAAGHVLRVRDHRHATISDRAQRLEADRDATVRAALAGERERIARELHDIVAHCVSVMVVQAGAAEDLLDRDPQGARAPLQSIQETGRQAVGELSRMLGLLRGQHAPPLTPQPGTAQLSELVTQMNVAGLSVRLDVEGSPRPLPPGVELAGFRIVQEALTNTLKHAGPATASVRLRYGERTLEVEVLDDGRGGGVNGHGHGLIGMRERVTLYGGVLDAGPRPDGGFAVRARLPVEAPS